MTRLSFSLIFSLGSLALGCAHAKSTEPASSGEKTAPAETAPAAAVAPVHKTHKTSDGIAIAASPEGILGADAVKQMKEKLEARGFLKKAEGAAVDEPTQAALRHFQEKEGLAATGFPDRETLNRLGVKVPDKAKGTEAKK